MKNALAAALCLIMLTGCTTIIHEIRDEPFQPDPTRTSLGADLDDFQIETAVGVNIKKAHPQLESAHVNVHSFNSVVLLTGEVASENLRALAGETARRFRGVRQVHNELQVQPETSLTIRAGDSWLTTKVKSKLIANKGLDSSKVKVVTENGVVYLMGLVFPREADIATQIARTTKGVRRVVKVFEYPDQ